MELYKHSRKYALEHDEFERYINFIDYCARCSQYISDNIDDICVLQAAISKFNLDAVLKILSDYDALKNFYSYSGNKTLAEYYTALYRGAVSILDILTNKYDLQCKEV